MTAVQTLQRVTWAVCGHAADAPVGHDWRHRHACPVCEPGRVDVRCPGVDFRNVTRTVRAVVRPARCFLCGAQPAQPYPAGLRCVEHAPGLNPQYGTGPVREHMSTYSDAHMHTTTTREGVAR